MGAAHLSGKSPTAPQLTTATAAKPHWRQHESSKENPKSSKASVFGTRTRETLCVPEAARGTRDALAGSGQQAGRGGAGVPVRSGLEAVVRLPSQGNTRARKHEQGRGSLGGGDSLGSPRGAGRGGEHPSANPPRGSRHHRVILLIEGKCQKPVQPCASTPKRRGLLALL